MHHPWCTPYGRPSGVQICSRQICQDPLEAMDGWKGQIVRTDDLHGASRPKGCAHGRSQ